MIAVTVQQNPIAVALIEPKPLLRDALQALVNADTRLTVVAAVSNAAELVSRVQHSRVDVALVALDAYTDGHAAMLTAILGGVSPPCRVLVVTNDASPGFRVRLIERGVKGVVLTHQTGDVLRRAIMRVHEGELWLDRSTVATVVRGLTRRRGDRDDEAEKIASLTGREREIVALVADGLTNAEIADRLIISALTVRNHLTSILGKLALTNRFQLAVYAFKRDLVLLPGHRGHATNVVRDDARH